MSPSGKKYAFSSSLTAISDWTPVEEWAWAQIKLGEKPVDFNVHCGTSPLDPRERKNALWEDRCRQISGRFLREILTLKPLRDETPFMGVKIIGAQVNGDIDLNSANLVRPIEIMRSRIMNVINLNRARTDSLISLNESFASEGIVADSMHSDSDLSLKDSVIRYNENVNAAVSLKGAKFEGNIAMTDAVLEGGLNAEMLRVGGYLGLSRARAHHINDTSITDDFPADLPSSSKNKTSDPLRDFAPIPERPFLQSPQSAGAKLKKKSTFSSAAFQIEPSLLPPDQTNQYRQPRKGDQDSGVYFRNKLQKSLHDRAEKTFAYPCRQARKQKENTSQWIFLEGAHVTGPLYMEGADFGVPIRADSLHIVGDLIMREARYCEGADMVFARIEGNLDLRGATLNGLDLWGAVISGDLRLGKSEKNSTVWNNHFNLQNARAGNLMDAQNDAWPTQDGLLHLDGFTFNHLGGTEVNSDLDERLLRKNELQREIEWWDKRWARLDEEFSPTPYIQLATALRNSGYYDEANEIRYLGRVRQTDKICSGLWRGNFWSCVRESALAYVAGYGIGFYTFRVLIWVVLFTLVGAALLWWTVPDAREVYKGDRLRGQLWCIGASFARLLPVIKLNEFEGFFDDLDNKKNDSSNSRFQLWQRVAFSALGLVGWILAAILGVAISGLTQAS